MTKSNQFDLERFINKQFERAEISTVRNTRQLKRVEQLLSW